MAPSLLAAERWPGQTRIEGSNRLKNGKEEISHYVAIDRFYN